MMLGGHAGVGNRPDNILAQRSEGIAGSVGLDRTDGFVGKHLNWVIEPDAIEWRRAGSVRAPLSLAVSHDGPNVCGCQAAEKILLAVHAFSRMNALERRLVDGSF